MKSWCSPQLVITYWISEFCVTICISKPIWGLPCCFLGLYYAAFSFMFLWFGFLVVDCLCVSSCSSSRSVLVFQFVTHSFNAWHSVSCLFYFSPFLGMRIALSLSSSLSHSLSSLSLSLLALLPPSFGALFLNPPHTVRFFRRMVTKTDCFFWMMHLGIYIYICFILKSNCF